MRRHSIVGCGVQCSVSAVVGSCPDRGAIARVGFRDAVCEAVSCAGPVPRISSSILSAMRWAASCSCAMVQSAA